MVILVHDVIDVFRCRELLACIGGACWLVTVGGDIIQSYIRNITVRRQRYLVRGLQVVDGEGLLCGAHLLI